MKKEIIQIAMLLMIFGLTACGTKTTSKEESSSYEKETSVESMESSSVEEVETTQEISTETETVGEEEETTTILNVFLEDHYLQEWGEFGPLCEITWQSVLLGEKEQGLFPNLQNALEELNESSKTSAKEAMDWILPEAMVAVEEDGEFFNGYTSATSYYVQRADYTILSVRSDYDFYVGGPHPNSGVTSINLDPITGETIALETVINDVDGLSTLLVEKLNKACPELSVEYFAEQLEQYKIEDYTWTLGYEDITFYFSPYDIAPYAVGLLTATFRFDEYPELVQEQYSQMPEQGYAVQVPFLRDIEIVLDHSTSEKDTLFLIQAVDTYGTSSLKIILNEELALDENYYAYKITPYLVCVKDGTRKNYFLYVEGQSDNGYCTLYVYELNHGAVRKVDALSGTGFHVDVFLDENESFAYYWNQVFNNPTEFILDTQINLFGIHTGFNTYEMDVTSGMPLPKSDVYQLEENIPPLISKVELEALILPKQTTETVPVGTSFHFVRTDNQTYVDMMLEDGRECRINIELSGGQLTINGLSEWECFEKIFFAG